MSLATYKSQCIEKYKIANPEKDIPTNMGNKWTGIEPNDREQVRTTGNQAQFASKIRNWLTLSDVGYRRSSDGYWRATFSIQRTTTAGSIARRIPNPPGRLRFPRIQGLAHRERVPVHSQYNGVINPSFHPPTFTPHFHKIQ